jgi:tripartite-type tricarboxylate transporter receptor subunit TctC
LSIAIENDKQETSMSTRSVISVFFLSLASLLSNSSRAADNYPNRPIVLQVGFSAGGATDRQFRTLAHIASKHLGQTVVVENKPGAAGTLAASTLAMSGKTDGYTLAQAPVGVFRVPHMQSVNWNPLRDFTYVIGMSGYVLGVAVRADSPFKSWDDVARYARANPGKLSYASTGVGGTMHLAMTDIEKRTGLQFNHIPYKGAADSSRALLSGEVMLQTDAVSGFAEMAAAGKTRILMVWEPQRHPDLPDVPTARELGLDIVYQSPFGLVGPAGMPPEVVEKLHDAFRKALQDPEHLKLLKQIYQTLWYQSPAQYAAYAKSAFEQERKLMEQAGLLTK